MENEFKQYLNFYSIDLKYIRELSRYDDNVMSISPQINKISRPFVGVVLLLNGKKYCIPLTSSKDKFKNTKSNVDFIKIFDYRFKDSNGAPKLIGVLNINNMIPVDDTVISLRDLTIHPYENKAEKMRKGLMQDQINWCRDNNDIICNRANKVYSIVTEFPDKNKRLVNRCCDFKKLEKVLDKYLEKQAVKFANQSLKTPLSKNIINHNAKAIKKQSSKHKNTFDKAKGQSIE
jgi:protein AbiQ